MIYYIINLNKSVFGAGRDSRPAVKVRERERILLQKCRTGVIPVPTVYSLDGRRYGRYIPVYFVICEKNFTPEEA